MAAVQPSGAGWREFSWHPFLMTSGFVGMFGAATMTKKRGGYTNTKVSIMLKMADVNGITRDRGKIDTHDFILWR